MLYVTKHQYWMILICLGSREISSQVIRPQLPIKIDASSQTGTSHTRITTMGMGTCFSSWEVSPSSDTVILQISSKLKDERLALFTEVTSRLRLRKRIRTAGALGKLRKEIQISLSSWSQKLGLLFTTESLLSYLHVNSISESVTKKWRKTTAIRCQW